MRHRQLISALLAGSLLLPGCAGDATKSSSEPASPTQRVQAEEGKDQPPSGEIQERAVLPRMMPGAGPLITQPQPPPPTSGPSGGRPGQSGVAVPPGGLPATPGPSNVGPTPNITKVANAFMQYHKSLTTLITVSPGLVLTQPVTISIGYYSPWGTTANTNRFTQTYAPTGNHFLINDNEGDGKPRSVHLDITLTEPKPGGGIYSYNIPADVSLDPLYDVSISPLVFTLYLGCVGIGANHIALDWYPPDASVNGGNYQTVKFNAVNGETFTINEFSWARQEVSASTNFQQPFVWYVETSIHCDPGCGFGPIPGGSGVPLVPSKTYSSSPGLVNSSGATQDCKATLNYTVTYTLRWYPFLGP